MNFIKGMIVGAIVGGSLMNMDKARMHKAKRKVMKYGKHWRKRLDIF